MTLNFNVNLDELNAKNTRKSDLRNMMDDFVKANAPAAEIDWHDNYSTATNAYSCMNNFLRRNPNYAVRVVRKNDKVYLMTKNQEPKAATV